MTLWTDLKVGDCIKVWWNPGVPGRPNTDTITRIESYTGPLECLKGARIAYFTYNCGGMTLEPGSEYEIVTIG